MLSEYTRVLSARSGSPEKKSTSSLYRGSQLIIRSPVQKSPKVKMTNIFEVLQEVGHCLSLDISEDGLIQAVARPPWAYRLARGPSSATAGALIVPPQHVELQTPMA